MDDLNNLLNENESLFDTYSLNLLKDNSLENFLNGRNCNYLQNCAADDNYNEWNSSEKIQNGNNILNSNHPDLDIKGKFII